MYVCFARLLTRSYFDVSPTASPLFDALKLCLHFHLISSLFSISPFPSDKPEFVNSPLTRFELAESESMSINLTARGNPSLVEYKWSRADGKEMDTVRFVADGPLLNVSSAVRSDSATYKIEATNEQGTSETTIILNVHCKLRRRRSTARLSSAGWSPSHSQLAGARLSPDPKARAFARLFSY